MKSNEIIELSPEEIEFVNGGSRLLRVARAVGRAIRDSLIYEGTSTVMGSEGSDYDWNEEVKDLQESGGYPRCGIGCPY